MDSLFRPFRRNRAREASIDFAPMGRAVQPVLQVCSSPATPPEATANAGPDLNNRPSDSTWNKGGPWTYPKHQPTQSWYQMPVGFGGPPSLDLVGAHHPKATEEQAQLRTSKWSSVHNNPAGSFQQDQQRQSVTGLKKPSCDPRRPAAIGVEPPSTDADVLWHTNPAVSPSILQEEASKTSRFEQEAARVQQESGMLGGIAGCKLPPPPRHLKALTSSKRSTAGTLNFSPSHSRAHSREPLEAEEVKPKPQTDAPPAQAVRNPPMPRCADPASPLPPPRASGPPPDKHTEGTGRTAMPLPPHPPPPPKALAIPSGGQDAGSSAGASRPPPPPPPPPLNRPTPGCSPLAGIKAEELVAGASRLRKPSSPAKQQAACSATQNTSGPSTEDATQKFNSMSLKDGSQDGTPTPVRSGAASGADGAREQLLSAIKNREFKLRKVQAGDTGSGKAGAVKPGATIGRSQPVMAELLRKVAERRAVVDGGSDSEGEWD